ncbi:MAG: SUMF1/EgtB/PvdO family nonheme iron enzyme [Acidobacteriota bacterium]
MRVYISSTSDDLAPYRAAAIEAARRAGCEPTVRNPDARRGLSRVDACRRQVAAADRLLAIVGWRHGPVPGPELGGDSRRSWTEWEVQSAFDHGRPVMALMAGDAWPETSRDADSIARTAVEDFRATLDRLAIRFAGGATGVEGSGSLDAFRPLVHRLLADARDAGREPPDAGERLAGLRLRSWPPPELPPRPYPVLLPYSHPKQLAGRQRELSELRQLLAEPIPILGLHAASGAGKSSLLAAGLIPALRAAGQPVAFDRHPGEAGLADRLLRDLLEADDEDRLAISRGAGPDAAGSDTSVFIDRLLAARQLAEAAPLLVLDQFEDIFLRPGGRRDRARVGALLAASVQRQPGLGGTPCRWILAYRQEFHGEVFRWLGDVLREARAEGFHNAVSLPHDLSGPERFHSWPLPPLGAPRPGSTSCLDEATRIFAAAIEKPLALTTADGGQRYPWRFADGAVDRLAEAFGAARVARPAAPLAPELQVVLAHLLERAGAAGHEDDALATLEVPDAPGTLIDQALEQHLRRAIDSTFFTASPGWRQATGTESVDAPTADTRIARTRALLALRELADAEGRRGDSIPAESLARAIGIAGDAAAGRQVLERLATPETRLVVAEQRGSDWCYVLSHDRLAELLVRLVDDEEAYADLGVDAELLALRRLVKLKTELFAAGEVERATEIASASLKKIGQHTAALLWGEASELWWQACLARARRERRRTSWRRAAVALVVSVVILGVWRLTDYRAQRAALFAEIAQGEPETAFSATDRLLTEWRIEPEALRDALRQRAKPLDVLERGLGGAPAGAARAEAVLRLAKLAHPLITVDAPEDAERIASLVWALDFFVPRDERARQLRDQALTPLRRKHPPPPLPADDDPRWVNIPAGSFLMGSAPGEGRDGEDKADEQPRHRVTLSAFRLATHETTNTELRRLYPTGAEGLDDNLPATTMTWYQAYTYAAWLGGRLPTEAEAEYVRRAGCGFAYCRRDGNIASLDEVAWWLGNSMDPDAKAPTLRPVGQLEPNPLGLYDLYGNVAELCADWYGLYGPEDQMDPTGPTRSESDWRLTRGGSIFESAEWVAPSARSVLPSSDEHPAIGLRVVLPAAQ